MQIYGICRCKLFKLKGLKARGFVIIARKVSNESFSFDYTIIVYFRYVTDKNNIYV